MAPSPGAAAVRQWAVAPGRSEIAATGDAFEQAYRAGVAEELPGAGADAARAVDTGARRGRAATAAGVAFGDACSRPTNDSTRASSSWAPTV